MTLRARLLTTVPDNTSQKFLLIGELPRDAPGAGGGGRQAVVFVDFANTRTRQCTDDDFVRWYARSGLDKSCLMGHKVRRAAVCWDDGG